MLEASKLQKATTNSKQLKQEALLVKGHIRDKMELIKIASAKVKARFRIEDNVDIIKAGDYDQELDGHICVAEFVCKEASSVRGRHNE